MKVKKETVFGAVAVAAMGFALGATVGAVTAFSTQSDETCRAAAEMLHEQAISQAEISLELTDTGMLALDSALARDISGMNRAADQYNSVADEIDSIGARYTNEIGPAYEDCVG